MPSNVSWAFIATCSPFILIYGLNIRILKNPFGQSQFQEVCVCKLVESEGSPGAGWSRTGVIDRAQGRRVREEPRTACLARSGAAVCTGSNVCAQSQPR